MAGIQLELIMAVISTELLQGIVSKSVGTVVSDIKSM